MKIEKKVRATAAAVIEMSETATRNLPALARSKRAVSEHAQEHAPGFSPAVLDKGNKVLLIKRNTEPFKNFWCLPGGHIDFGETAEESVIREVKEETGLDFQPKFLGYRDEIYLDIGWHGEVLLFYGKSEGKESIDGKEISDIGWFDFDKAYGMELAFGHQKSLEIYRKRRIKND